MLMMTSSQNLDYSLTRSCSQFELLDENCNFPNFQPILQIPEPIGKEIKGSENKFNSIMSKDVCSSSYKPEITDFSSTNYKTMQLEDLNKVMEDINN